MLQSTWILFCTILWLCFCCFHFESTRAFSNSTSPGLDERKKFRDEFDWIAYLQIYPDLGDVFSTKEESTNHYNTQGKKEGRIAVRTLPMQPGFNYAIRKLAAYTKGQEKSSVDDRTLILYNLHPVDSKGDTHGLFDLLLNNLQIFLHATYKDDSEKSTNFYWFNIIDPENNQFKPYIKSLPQWNTAVVERGIVPNDLFAHFRTLSALRNIVKTKFRSVFFLSNLVRGPFTQVDNGLWVKEYTKLLFLRHNGMVGSTMSCDPAQVQTAAIHTHVFMLRTTILNYILVEFTKFKKSTHFHAYTNDGYEAGLSSIMEEHHWNISALLNYHRMNQLSFNNTCLPMTSSQSVLMTNPNDRCDLKAEEVIFFKWHGLQILNHYEKMNCDTMLQYMSSLLQIWKQQNESLVLHLSEGMKDGEVLHTHLHRTGHHVQLKHALSPEADTHALDKLRDSFDWRAYLELYPDLGKVLNNKDDALHHYIHNGRYENRLFPKIFPLQPGLSMANRKLIQFISRTSTNPTTAGERVFVCYNLHMNQIFDSYEVIINNIMLFHRVVIQDASPESTNFYWINIIGENNLYERHIDIHNQWNVAIVTRSVAPSDLFVHLRTFALLKHTLKHKFKAVFCLNSGTRGPLVAIENGAWIKSYVQLLFQAHTGLVGPTIVCDETITPSPHIPLYAFIIRANLLTLILGEFGSFKRMNNVQVFTNSMYEVGISTEMIKHGWKIASLLDYKRFGSEAYNGTCILPPYPTQSMYVPVINNPSLWCNLQPEEVIFYHWNGIVFAENYLCPQLKNHMISMLTTIQAHSIATNPEKQRLRLRLRIPEVLKGGEIIHLYREYDQEVGLPALSPPPLTMEELKEPDRIVKDKVCFLIRTCEMHDVAKVQEDNQFKDPIDIFDETGIADIIICKDKTLQLFFAKSLVSLTLLLTFFCLSFFFLSSFV